MPPLTTAVAAPALTAVAMEAVPELCPSKIETIAKQSRVGPEKARPTLTQEPSTYKTTATQSRAHNSSDPPKLTRLQLISDIEGCKTGQWCTILYDGKTFPGIMRRVMDVTKDTVAVQCV